LVGQVERLFPLATLWLLGVVAVAIAVTLVEAVALEVI
jgi:hypothetical protein